MNSVDFSVSSSEQDAHNAQTTASGYPSSGPFRTSVSTFSPFSNPGRVRQNTASFRDTSTNFTTPNYAQVHADIFVPNNMQQNPPHSAGGAYEPIHHPGRYDYALSASQSAPSLMPNGQTKQFTVMDAYRLGLDPSLNLTQQMKMSSSGSPPGMMRDAQVPQMSMQQGAQQSFQTQLNGISHQLPHQLQPQGPFQSVNGSAPVSGTQAGLANGAGTQQGSQQQPQEEISTIFVVGFPDDMSEREFQNMFTFSNGFEAATLKIPNRDYTSLAGGTARTTALPLHYAGSNDPYNLVTVNQGGVVVDGRDGTTSWPAPSMSYMDEGHFIPSALPLQPPRKQIIGFAKFRSRQEALDARDILQGRRVDIEKGSVLKAEMAKKNLHTKRGPGMGPMGIGSLLNGTAAMQADALASLNGLGLGGPSAGPAGEVFVQREKELGIGPMAIAGLSQRRDRLPEARDDRGDVVSPIGLSTFGTRGARERAEEDERERERKRKEKEAVRLRQNSFAFEAFHSVPQQMVRQGANSLLSAENGIIGGGYGSNGHSLSTQSSLQSIGSQTELNGMSTWGTLRDVSVSAALRKMPVHLTSSLPQRPSSPGQQESPTNREAAGSPPSGAASASDSTNPSATFSPPSAQSVLPSLDSFTTYPRASSPSNESQGVHLENGSSLPTSSASSINGAHNINDELARAVGALAVSTDQQGTISPQLPSPASNTSSGNGRNPGDQNPPINTLYVGNLPTSSSPGGSPPLYLEERLRELFSKRTGYRKLCFRQKSNGPMCFVEFEDVAHATKTLHELYGDTLGGLVKSGIRLSYSKNPLGVRTPTSGGSGPSLQQQQQQINQQQTQAFYNTQLQKTADIDTYHLVATPPRE
ncbi:hypothetical protein EW026_g4528 [Hermanssonia centrifuga]|uniref:RRM domain-containing protein n=1 Tax=Hermanssonia centrifuga TaxID=98765 RepID=A0A4S4KGV0_9APHY|nr:hypothetical protein EW026_g4528 [Hermanssonia centrifuga]